MTAENPNAKYLILDKILQNHCKKRNSGSDRELLLSANDEQMIFDCMIDYATHVCEEKDKRIKELEVSLTYQLERSSDIIMKSSRLADVLRSIENENIDYLVYEKIKSGLAEYEEKGDNKP